MTVQKLEIGSLMNKLEAVQKAGDSLYQIVSPR